MHDRMHPVLDDNKAVMPTAFEKLVINTNR